MILFICFQLVRVSNDGAFRRLQPPPGCQTGWFLWHYPRDTVNLTFPRSLLPSGSSNKMKVCFKLGVGQGLLEIIQKTRRRSRTLPPLSQDTSNRGLLTQRTLFGVLAAQGELWMSVVNNCVKGHLLNYRLEFDQTWQE